MKMVTKTFVLITSIALTWFVLISVAWIWNSLTSEEDKIRIEQTDEILRLDRERRALEREVMILELKEEKERLRERIKQSTEK